MLQEFKDFMLNTKEYRIRQELISTAALNKIETTRLELLDEINLRQKLVQDDVTLGLYVPLQQAIAQCIPQLNVVTNSVVTNSGN